MLTLLDDLEKKDTKVNNAVKTYTGSSALNEICFPTEIKKIGYCDEKGKFHHSDTNGFFDMRTNELLYAGPQYIPTKNEVIVNNLDKLFDNGFVLENVKNYRDRKFEINLIHPDITFNIGPEKANYRCLITNSYNGSSRLSLELGAYVFICSNGLKVSYGKDISLKFKHTQDHNFGDLMLDKTVESLDYVKNKLAKKEWEGPNINVKNMFLRLTNKISDRVDNDNKKTPSKAKKMLNDRFQIEANKYHSEFALFMAATYLSTHGIEQGLSLTSANIIDKEIEPVFFGDK